MENETQFQVSVIILFCTLAVIGMYHRIKAAKSNEKISRQREGLFIMIVLRLFGFSMWIALIIYMINPQWMAWAAVSLPNGLRWLGALITLLALPLLYWMFSSLGKNITDTVAIRKEHQLVTYGPYRYIRHPMYLFSLIYITGISLLAANVFIWLCGLLTLLLLIMRTPIEEADLIEKFGEQYHDYMTRTGRFFPRLVNQVNKNFGSH
jgi:protein-S-isoprenylcysteine O-methyltransferase Ste14